MTVADVFAKIAADLAWRGPGGRPLGHILLTRAEAELILAALTNTEKDKTYLTS